MDSKPGKLCRLCLINSNESITLFTDAANEIKIAEIIAKHFWFTPDEHDNYSNNVCHDCWQKVYTFHTFYEEVKLVHDNLSNVLSQTLNATTAADHKIIDDVKREEADAREVDDDFQCDKEKSDDSMPPPPKHKKGGRKKKIAPNTGRSGKRDDEKLEQEVKRLDDDSRIREFFNLKCDLCDTKSSTFIEVRAHYRLAHKIRRGYLTCCKRKFFYRGEILEHMFWHLNPEAFKCAVCSKSFPTKWKLDLHMHYHAPDEQKIYCCDICGNRYSKKCQVKQHIYLIHAFRKELKCDQCDKLFRLNSQLMAHIRNVHENANQRMCDICAKVFKSKFQSDLHRRTEHPINGQAEIFQCSQCGTFVKHHRALRRHMLRYHSAVTEYSCDQCGRLVSSKESLRTHIRLVHESHPAKHKCSLCGKAFRKLLILREHMATHTGAILYRCDYCSKPFRSIANKYSHLRKVHPTEWEQNRATKKFCKTVNIKESL